MQPVPEELRDYARVLVRAGYASRDEVLADVSESARHDHRSPDPDQIARELVDGALAELRAEQAGWPQVTDYDRLVAAFAELRARGVVVLPHVDDHWAAAAELRRAREHGAAVAGVLWFTPPDVWHAVRHGMLELNLWHADSANVAPGDDLLATASEALTRQGLSAHFDEGRIEVAARWQRRSVAAGDG